LQALGSNNLQAVSNKTDAAQVEIAPSGFKRIGTRYFRVVYEVVNWDTANRKCREMGGYLASIQSEREFNAVTGNLDPLLWLYWLGINDQETEGHYVSVASGKPAEFLRWFQTVPDDINHTQNCVVFNSHTMFDVGCNQMYYFICQAD
ncbi:hypothetical protein KR032_010054, partial [Drosophila birchii]